jgi:hypothetical protein
VTELLGVYLIALNLHLDIPQLVLEELIGPFYFVLTCLSSYKVLRHSRLLISLVFLVYFRL